MTMAQVIENDILASKDVFAFGPFRLFPSARRLERDGVPIQLGSRAFDILLILVSHSFQIVGKATLLKYAWQNLNVDEGNLRFQVNALRKALGDDGPNPTYVATVQGQGYRFVASVSRAAGGASGSDQRTATASQGLPVRRTRLLGRDFDVRSIVALLNEKRFVTIVGPGGVGKTSVAIVVAQVLIQDGDETFAFLDLGSLADPALVASAVATALGIPVRSNDPIPSILAQLENRRVLLILDCCEHVIETVASVADQIAAAAPNVKILATSREPLRVESECVFRLPPLACPPEAPTSVSDSMTYSAVQLFIERVSMSFSDYVLQENEAEAVALICRRLDGLPLAIEFAAGQVAAFGIRRLTELLQDKLSLLWQGQRTALPRHQTLNATLDWSYALLSDIEKRVLGRLAVFVGAFTIESAISVVSTSDLDGTEIVAAIGSLVSKSLISANFSGGDDPRYRLLDVTRTYAMQRLEEAGELPELRSRHARFIHETLMHGAQVDRRRSGGSPSGGACSLDDVRAALDWAFSPDGDPSVAVGLAAASAQIWLGVGLLVECCELMRKAVGYLEAGGA
jgi:predicted ATPase/DNA-binding winged helix-turn-helix (wHTH) protein